MDFICKRCCSVFQRKTNRELICENCKVQIDLLEKELTTNNERIKKLEEHKKSELKNPKSKNPEIHLETMKRLEKNLQLEHKKSEGIIKMMKSSEKF